MELYGLYSEKRDCLMGFSVSSNGDGEFCDPVAFQLDRVSAFDPLWVSTKSGAEKVAALGPTPGYNAGDHNTPHWDRSRYGTLTAINLNQYKGCE